MPGPAQGLLVGRAGGMRQGVLLGVEGVDAGAVLGADVVALTHPLGGVVRFPEDSQQPAVGDPGRVPHHQHHLVVPGQAGAHLLVGGVRGKAAGIAHRGAEHALGLPEAFLGAPEAAHAEQGLAHPIRERRLDGVAVDEMPVAHRHGPGTPRQGLVGGGHLHLAGPIEHQRILALRRPGSKARPYSARPVASAAISSRSKLRVGMKYCTPSSATP